MAAWPGLLGSFPCYTLQSLGYHEQYGVSICLPGLLLLLPVERAGHWRGRMCQSLVVPVSTGWKHWAAMQGTASGSGHHTSVQAGATPPAKTGFSALGITKQSLT